MTAWLLLFLFIHFPVISAAMLINSKRGQSLLLLAANSSSRVLTHETTALSDAKFFSQDIQGTIIPTETKTSAVVANVMEILYELPCRRDYQPVSLYKVFTLSLRTSKHY
jgi:hypothetical protein